MSGEVPASNSAARSAPASRSEETSNALRHHRRGGAKTVRPSTTRTKNLLQGSTAPISRRTATPANCVKGRSGQTLHVHGAARSPAGLRDGGTVSDAGRIGRAVRQWHVAASRVGKASSFYGVLKQNLKATIAGINETLLTTLGACGDVERNVMACPAAAPRRLAALVQAMAAQLAALPMPAHHGLHEIWLNGKHLGGQPTQPAEPEPLYGKVYLPPQIQNRRSPAGGQLHRRLRPGPGPPWPSSRTTSSSVTTSSSAAAWACPRQPPTPFRSWPYPICYVPAADVVRAPKRS